MALDDLLARLKAADSVTPVTPRQWAGVTPKPASVLAVTRVTPVTPPETIVEQEKPLPATRDYFTSLGLELLPEDAAFLAWNLPRATTARNQALREYLHRWRQAMDAEPAEHRRQNQGRFAANSWLRERNG